MAITVGTPINRVDGTKQISFSQSAPAVADEILAVPGAGYRIVVISILASLSAAGTLQLLSTANPISGAIDLGAGVPFGWKGSVRQPFVECNSSEALRLTTTVGAAKGVIVYKVVQSNQA